ncbi:MAG: hypothetical protein ACLUEQ_06370 [Cloacibacillus evryensis]
MKKFLVLAVIAAAITSFSPQAFAVTKMKLAYVVPEAQSTQVAAFKFFKPYCENHTNGAIIVELYPNGVGRRPSGYRGGRIGNDTT